jgi:pyruvate,water dikinase
MTPVALRDAVDEQQFGGKAAQLAVALQAGLPAPDGVALSTDTVEAIHGGSVEAIANLEQAFEQIHWPVAVRSSGIGEDGEGSSFAGQHDTLLNILGASQAIDAVRQVRDSGHTEAARAYRQHMGLPLEPQIGVVIQRLVNPDCAGVLFTCNPINGADERVVEAAWGFGEVVVSGLVTPDHYRFSRDGTLLETNAGYKDIELIRLAGGGLEEQIVDADRAEALCIAPPQIIELNQLAQRCEQVYGGDQDIEWAFAEGELYLLQRRAVTAIGGG